MDVAAVALAQVVQQKRQQLVVTHRQRNRGVAEQAVAVQARRTSRLNCF